MSTTATTAALVEPTDQRALAREIQGCFLPLSDPAIEGYDLASYHLPAQDVGGDFYHFEALPTGEWGLALGDVAGRGLAGALLMAQAVSALRAHVQRAREPDAVLAAVDLELLARMRDPRRFVALLYGILDPPSGDFRFASAAAAGPRLSPRAGAALETLEGTGLPLGIQRLEPELANAYGVQRCRIDPGGFLLLATDGWDAALGPSAAAALRRELDRHGQGGAAQLCEALGERAADAGGTQGPPDDITLIVLRRDGPLCAREGT